MRNPSSVLFIGDKVDYIHIRTLEKYHPGYKDRTLQWGKIYFKMAQGDPDCDIIENEIDWGRLIKIILLELEAQQPLPNIDSYWVKKGFDIRKRPMSLTLKMLHNFVEVIQDLTLDRHVDKEKEEDKDKIVTHLDFLTTLKENASYSHIDIDTELGKMDAWLLAHPGRQKTKRFVVNWLNKIEKSLIINKPKERLL